MKNAVLLLLTMISLCAGAASTGGARDSLIRDSQRRKALAASAQAWFDQQVRPRIQLSSVSGGQVMVQEPTTVLPPDLGGPLNFVQVTVEARFSGWSDGFDRFSRFPDRGFVDCRFEQKLWAHLDSDGRPIRIRAGQAALAPIACASPGYLWPDNPMRSGRR